MALTDLVPDSIKGLLDLDDGTWRDRLREAAYTPPSGTRILFAYEDVARSTKKRTASFEFSGVDGGYVQDNGSGSRRYPLRCFFSGPNHDLIATAFEAALLERGPGKLEHPLYGPATVVPYGEISRRDDLVSAANQTIVEVTFWSTIGAVYPGADDDPVNEIEALLGDFDVAAAQSFSESMSLLGAIDKANAVAKTRALLGNISDALGDVSKSVASVNRDFRELQSTINLGMDVLIGQPLLLARQMTDLVRAPARALDGLKSRMDGYRDLAASIFGADGSTPSANPSYGSTVEAIKRRASNEYHNADHVAISGVSGAVASAINTTYETRTRAIEDADDLLSQLEDVVAWREASLAALGQVDPASGAAYQALQDAVALTAGYLVRIASELLIERSIVIDRPRTIIDLAAELYGSVDDNLDLLIDSNQLTGSEILELPRGRRIVYYER